MISVRPLTAHYFAFLMQREWSVINFRYWWHYGHRYQPTAVIDNFSDEYMSHSGYYQHRTLVQLPTSLIMGWLSHIDASLAWLSACQQHSVILQSTIFMMKISRHQLPPRLSLITRTRATPSITITSRMYRRHSGFMHFWPVGQQRPMIKSILLISNFSAVIYFIIF